MYLYDSAVLAVKIVNLKRKKLTKDYQKTNISFISCFTTSVIEHNNCRWPSFSVLFASTHKVNDKKYVSFTVLSIVHSIAPGFGIKFVHRNVSF